MGIVALEDAMKQAEDVGLDLMEVSPNSDPPVCRIVNFGKLKYEKKKRYRSVKRNSMLLRLKKYDCAQKLEIMILRQRSIIWAESLSRKGSS